jgi:hypothetical protein
MQSIGDTPPRILASHCVFMRHRMSRSLSKQSRMKGCSEDSQGKEAPPEMVLRSQPVCERNESPEEVVGKAVLKREAGEELPQKLLRNAAIAKERSDGVLFVGVSEIGHIVEIAVVFVEVILVAAEELPSDTLTNRPFFPARFALASMI